MSYFGILRGRRKAASTIRIVHNGGGSSSIQFDTGTATPITFDTTGWTVLFASTANIINMIEIFDSTGNTARLGSGASGSEADLLLISPGGNGALTARVDAGTRLVLRPIVTPGANTETVINFYD